MQRTPQPYNAASDGGALLAAPYQFEGFELDIARYELRRNGHVLKLEKIPMELLILLVSRQGELVSREEIVAKLWGQDVFIETEHSINTAVRKIRQTLGDDPERSRFVQTVVGKGYRFVGPINGIDAAPAVDRSYAPVVVIEEETRRCGPKQDLPVESPRAIAEISRKSPRRVSRKRALLLLMGALAGGAAALFVVAARLGWLTTLDRQEHSLVSERQVTANSTEAPVLGAAISPDGRYVAYLDTTGVYLRETHGGETHPLRVPKDFAPVPTSWFPDNASFVATLDAGPRQPPSVWKLSVLGAPPQKLSDDAWGASVSGDGSEIAFLRGGPAPPGNGLEIWTMESNGADQRQITTAAAGDTLGSVAWSPEGKRIAYFRIQPGPVTDHVSLETHDSKGLQPATVVLNDRLLGRALCWSADGRIFFSHLRSETPNLEGTAVWAVTVDEAKGEARDQPHPVSDAHNTSGIGWISDLSISHDSKHLTLVRHSAEPQVFVADLQSGRPRHLQQPHRLTLDQRANVPFAWTPDSKNVLFISTRNGVWNIFKQAIDRPTAELFVGGKDRIFGPRLSPDGSEIFYLVMPRLGGPASEVSLMRVPVSGGPPRLVLREPGISDVQCAHIRSSRCILVQQQGGAVAVHSFDPLSNKREALLRFSTSSGISLSPDGSDLAIISHEMSGRIQLFSIATRQSREILVKGWAELRNVDWSADARTLFVPATRDEHTVALLEIDLQGNAWELLRGQLGWAIPSPDGRHLAFMQVTGENNVWMLEDF